MKLFECSIILCLLHANAFGSETPMLKSFGRLPEKYPASEALGSVPSPYREKVLTLVATWPKKSTFNRKTLPPADGADIETQCYETPKNPTYIGVGQRMVVAVPYERMVEIVDDFPAYVGLFEGLVRVTAKEWDGNRTVTEWEEEIPFPFVPNEHNQMIHLISSPRPGLKIYRYGLKRSDNMVKNDGAIVLERGDKGQTLYSEFDFFDANWGIAKSFGVERVWKDSLEGLFQSDLALKLRAENPSWTTTKVRAESLARAKALMKRKDYCPRVAIPVADTEVP